jgi:UDP-GlcNAc:undecaprenyl-phosphate GlcNAc-1-phosphate transferase
LFSLFLLYLLIGFIVHLIVRHIFKKRNFVDIPDGIKKKHELAVPISGGLSFAICWVFYFSFTFLILFYELGDIFGIEFIRNEDPSKFAFPIYALLTFLSLVLLSICLIDDLINLPIWVRLFTQISCAVLMIELGGMNLLNLGPLFGFEDIILPYYLGFVFTIFCVVGLTNAFNWIDGIDGFFSFQVFLSCIGISILSNNLNIATLAFLCALLPYTIMNLGLMGKKFKVFIGDHGAMMIGFFLGCNFVLITQDSYDLREVDVRPVDALWCVGLVLLNALRVIWKRFNKKLSIFNSDREHIHHYFLDQGYSDKSTLAIVCALSLAISSLGWIICYLGLPEWFSLMMFISILFFWVFIGKFTNSISKSPQESLRSSK